MLSVGSNDILFRSDISGTRWMRGTVSFHHFVFVAISIRSLEWVREQAASRRFQSAAANEV
jgi:hypothetical protein